MKARLFEPFIGDKYFTDGINGLRVLVVGASFYCNKKECEHFSDCTDDNKKDSSPYDYLCPFYDAPLHNAPSEESGLAYDIFQNKMSEILNLNGDFWSYVAFTNYIQYFLGHWQTYRTNCSERDAVALEEVVTLLEPDVVIIWGTKINKPIKDKYQSDQEIPDNTEGYISRGKIGEREVVFLNTYHPKYSGFEDNGNLKKYVSEIFINKLKYFSNISHK